MLKATPKSIQPSLINNYANAISASDAVLMRCNKPRETASGLPPHGRCQPKASAPSFAAGGAFRITCGAYRLAASRSFSVVQAAGSSAPSASPCCSSQRSASMAAREPSPAAVTAWR